MSEDGRDFELVYADITARLVKVLVARYGREVAAELTADVAAYAWEHRERVVSMDNPMGYLYRVAQSRARRYARWGAARSLRMQQSFVADFPDVDLQRHLESLPVKQRMCVVLVHGYQWTYDETATALGLSVAAVRNHLHRGLRTLRNGIAVTEDD